jgi:hypothetical protein
LMLSKDEKFDRASMKALFWDEAKQ